MRLACHGELHNRWIKDQLPAHELQKVGLPIKQPLF